MYALSDNTLVVNGGRGARTFFNRSNPCPVCGRGDKKCAGPKDDSNRVWCGGAHGDVPGWVEDKWIPGAAKVQYFREGSRSPRERARGYKGGYLKAVVQASIDKEIRGGVKAHYTGLSRRAKDAEYNVVIEALELGRGKEFLEARGLRESYGDIAAAVEFGIRWWTPHKRVQADKRLPGVVGGLSDSRLGGRHGVFIPMRDADGLIVGGQNRTLDNPNAAKYNMTSSANSGGSSSHLESGEMPIAVCWDQGPVDAVWLVDGAYKAWQTWYCAQQLGLNVAVIGCVGTPAWSEELRVSLEKVGQKTVTIMPDAGMTQNKQVSVDYTKCRLNLEENGYEVAFGWWGQQKKGASPDIDELLITILNKKRDYVPGLMEQLDGQSRTGVDFLGETGFRLLSVDEWKSGHAISIRELMSKAEAERQGQGVAEALRPGRRKTSAKPAGSIIQYVEDVAHYQESERQARWLDPDAPRIILDSSGPGAGKSHTVGELVKADVDGALGIDAAIIYSSMDPYNPTTETLKGWPHLKGRHNGLKEKQIAVGDRTVTGQMRAEEGYEGMRTEMPNCIRAGIAGVLADKNQYVSPCQGCHFLASCRTGQPNGPRYLFERNAALLSSQFRCHPNSFSPSWLEESGLKKDLVVVLDEAGTAPWIRTLKPTRVDVDRTELKLKKAFHQALREGRDEKAAQLAQLIDVNGIFSDAMLGVYSDSIKNYGFYGPDLFALFQDLVSTVNIAPSLWDELYPVEDIQSLMKSDDHAQDVQGLKQFDSFALKRDKELRSRLAEGMEMNYLYDLIEIFAGRQKGGVSVHDGYAVLDLPNAQMISFLKSDRVKRIILLDATGRAGFFQEWLGEEVQHIRTEGSGLLDAPNLEVIQIPDAGSGNKHRGKRQTEIRAAITKKNKGLYKGRLGVFDLGDYVDGQTANVFSDGRGSNAYTGELAVQLNGKPIKNETALYRAMQARTGRVPTTEKVLRSYARTVSQALTLDSFDVQDVCEFRDEDLAKEQRWELEATTIQCIGRLRANRREEDLTAYIINDYCYSFPVTVSEYQIECPNVTFNNEERISYAIETRHNKRAEAKLGSRAELIQMDAISIARSAKVSLAAVKRSSALRAYNAYVASFSDSSEVTKTPLIYISGSCYPKPTPNPEPERVSAHASDEPENLTSPPPAKPPQYISGQVPFHPFGRPLYQFVTPYLTYMDIDEITVGHPIQKPPTQKRSK